MSNALKAIFAFLATSSNTKIHAAADGQTGPRKCDMTAYTGGMMELGGWPHPVAVDLEGIAAVRKSRPLFLNHDATQIVGHTDKVQVIDGRLMCSGTISGVGAAAQEVTGAADNGFPWQASIGAKAKKVVFVGEGKSAMCNGQQVDGPAYIVRKSTLGEISFVPLGADDNTSATLAASADDGAMIDVEADGNTNQEGENMDFNAWVKAKGFDPAAISAAQKQYLQAQYDAEKAGPAAPAATPGLTLQEMRAEQARTTAILASCKDQPEIANQAITEGWSVEKAELAAMKASKVRKEQDSGVGASTASEEVGEHDKAAIKAAALLQGMMPEKAVAKHCGERAVNDSAKFRRMGLKDLAAACCVADGVAAPKFGMGEKEWVRAAFSSATFTNLLSDSANKIMLAAYNAVPSTARKLAKALTANDFKIHKGVRLTGDLIFKKVEAGGEITHGTLSDDSYSYSVDTFGRMIGLTRQMLINDDLGAFMELPRMFGRGSALAVENLFWTLVLANTGTFFGTGNANYISGATTNLSAAGLKQAVQALEEQVDQDDNPIMIQGKYLVVPPVLKTTAQELYVATNLVGGSSTVPNANVFGGLYEPVSSPYLKSKAKEWYLFGDPADVAAFGIAWLNGVQEPVVEEVELSGDVLGRAWRGYIDVGVCQVDPRGAVKSKGEA